MLKNLSYKTQLTCRKVVIDDVEAFELNPRIGESLPVVLNQLWHNVDRRVTQIGR